MSTTTTPAPATNTAKPDFTPPPPSPEHLATKQVADRLVALVREGKSYQAIQELYADNARHLEPFSMPGCPGVNEGKQRLLQMCEHWEKTTTVHSATCGDPIVNGNQFICPMSLDATSTEGPMANKRMQMSETALYTVKDGKITEARFFYGCGM
ncbi:MAG TPA: nuclear transport factor 2 family protein [Phycisphaerales bacterium]|nr:nuclear transport factor 2 family protein [Phycisphaerales bacterium]